MPVISDSKYVAPKLWRNPHLQTIYCSLFRKTGPIAYRRERIWTPDQDFLDLDWSEAGSRRLVILTHGLEGCSFSTYIKGMARAVNACGWDALGWNFRGCSGEPNLTLRYYHSGSTDDLEVVLRHVESLKRYDEIFLIGFSIGGNLTLKFLGEKGADLPYPIRGSVAFSVPCDLKDSAEILAKPANVLYMQDFLRFLRRKMEAKARLHPELDLRGFWQIRTFKQYDDRFTAPLHGFASAEDYWERCSSERFIRKIGVPSLIVNSLDDPFLGKKCYPLEAVHENPLVFLETPARGGHVAFMSFEPGAAYWSEIRALEFMNEVCGTGSLTDGMSRLIVGSSRVDLQACKLEYSIVSPK